MNIKVLVNSKLQPRRHTDTLIFTSIHLMYLMIHFLIRKLKNIIASANLFKFDFYLFSTGTATTNKLDDGILVAHFYNLKYWYSKRFLNCKQIRWQYTVNKFFRTSSVGTWTTNKSNDNISVTHFQGFNTGIFCKTAPSRFVENDDDAKSVLNSHHHLF